MTYIRTPIRIFERGMVSYTPWGGKAKEVQDILAKGGMATYPKLVDTSTGKSGGDPFVLAVAMSAEPACVVVSQEMGGSERSPKIPYVCQREGLDCINLLQLIEREDWSF